MTEYAEVGEEVHGSRTYLNPDTTYMENGKYYEAIYDVGGIQPIYDPNWREEALFRAQSAVESTPGCYLSYAYVQPNGQVKVQWLYDYDAYMSQARSLGINVPMVPPLILAVIVIVAVAAAIAVIFLYLTISQFSLISPEATQSIQWIAIAIAAIAVAIIVFLIIRAFNRLRD